MVGAGKAAVEMKMGSACEAVAGPAQGPKIGEGLAGWDRGPHLVPQPGYFRSWFFQQGNLWDQLRNQSGEVGWVIPAQDPSLAPSLTGYSGLAILLSLLFCAGCWDTELNQTWGKQTQGDQCSVKGSLDGSGKASWRRRHWWP